jgi:hypothetical protein
MNNSMLHELVNSMSPEEALHQMAHEIKGLLSHLREDARRDFLTGLMGETSPDGETSLVHL